MGSILHLHTVPPTGGDTLFASSNAAYEALSEPMKQFLGGLKARHDGTPNYNRRARIDLCDHGSKTLFNVSAVDVFAGDFLPMTTIAAHQPHGTHIEIKSPTRIHGRQIARV